MGVKVIVARSFAAIRPRPLLFARLSNIRAGSMDLQVPLIKIGLGYDGLEAGLPLSFQS
jgi:hypothetical protein